MSYFNTSPAFRLVGYTTSFVTVDRARGLGNGCAVMFAIGPQHASVVSALDRIYPHHVVMHALTDGEMWSAAPLACWTAAHPPADC